MTELPEALKQLAEELQNAIAGMMATPESMARELLATRYNVPNDEEHVRVTRAEISDDGTLYVTGAVKLDAPAHNILVTFTAPSPT